MPAVSPGPGRASRRPRRRGLRVLSLLPWNLLVLVLPRAEEGCPGPQEASAGGSGRAESGVRAGTLVALEPASCQRVGSRLLGSTGGFRSTFGSILYSSYRMIGP